MRNNLTKKEIGWVTTEELNYRYCHLLKKGETLPANEITVADAREILRIENQLRERTIKAVGHDFYPPDRVEKKTPSNYMISLLAKTKSESKPSINIKFRVVVKSSIGSKVAEFSVDANSKTQGDMLALKMIKKLGLRGVTYKLS